MSTFDKLLFAAKLAGEKPYRYTPASGGGYWVEDGRFGLVKRNMSWQDRSGMFRAAVLYQDLRMALTAEQVREYERGR